MSKKILFLQFRTDKSQKHERVCIMTKMKLLPQNFEIYNVLDPNQKLPTAADLSNFAGIITGASGQFNITDEDNQIKKFIERARPLFIAMIQKDIPTLAICFGHQLIAQLFGGSVIRDNDQRETGTLEVTLTNTGKKAKIYQGVPMKFNVVLGHRDSVVSLPKNAKLLAFSQKCRIESYQIGENVFTTQFHPELNLDDLIWRLKLYPEYLNGQTIAEIRTQYQEITYAAKILTNFKKLIS